MVLSGTRRELEPRCCGRARARWLLLDAGCALWLAACSAQKAPAADGAGGRADGEVASARLPAAPAGAAEAALLDYKKQLSEAGDKGACDPAVLRVRDAMAKDARLADTDLRAEIEHFEKVKGSMPYPSPGTACSLFGFQRAARGALEARAR